MWWFVVTTYYTTWGKVNSAVEFFCPLLCFLAWSLFVDTSSPSSSKEEGDHDSGAKRGGDSRCWTD